MAEIQKGLAVGWGITTTKNGMSVVGVGVGNYTNTVFVPTSQSQTNDGEQVEHIDPLTGETIGVTIFNRTSTLEMTVYPSDTTRVLAKGAASLLPKKGDNMKIADAVDTQLKGWWHVESVTKNKEAGEKISFNVTLKRWEGMTDPDPESNTTEGGYKAIP
jgi:hypothetical protein